MSYIFYRFACLWVWSLFVLSLVAIGCMYYKYYLYWRAVDTIWNKNPPFSYSQKHYIFTSAGIPFISAVCELQHLTPTIAKPKRFLFPASSIFKLFPKCMFKVLKNVHAVCQLIAFVMTFYGICCIMHYHHDNATKFDVRSMHACFGWTTFILFALIMLISPFIFIPPFFSQEFKKFMIGIHSLFSFCTLFFAIITMMTGNITNFDYIVP